MPKVAPWTERLWELVSDGPVPYYRAVAEMTRLVHPGRAFRDGERTYEWSRNKHLRETRKSSKRIGPKADRLDDEDRKDLRIRQGADRIVKSAIWTQKKRGHIEIYEENGEKMIRKGGREWPSAGLPPRSKAISQRRYLSPWTDYVRERLHEGPHVYRELVSEAAQLVPEDRARKEWLQFRAAQRRRRKTLKTYFIPPEREVEQNRLGAEQLVYQAMRHARLSDRIEIYEEDGKKMVRAGSNPWPW